MWFTQQNQCFRDRCRTWTINCYRQYFSIQLFAFDFSYFFLFFTFSCLLGDKYLECEYLCSSCTRAKIIKTIKRQKNISSSRICVMLVVCIVLLLLDYLRKEIDIEAGKIFFKCCTLLKKCFRMFLDAIGRTFRWWKSKKGMVLWGTKKSKSVPCQSVFKYPIHGSIFKSTETKMSTGLHTLWWIQDD